MIDFESKFRQFLIEYKKINKIEDELLDDIASELYVDWLTAEKKWLDGKSPVDYFKSFDAPALIEQLGAYIMSTTALPSVLLNQITDTKDETYPYLITLLKNYEGEKSAEIKLVIVRLIEEMDMAHPYEYYIQVISEADGKNDFIESAAEELKNTGEEYLEELILAYEQAKNAYVSDCFLDVLCDVSFDECIYQFALEKFLYGSKNKAFYASCLGKLGNTQALPYLKESLNEDSIGYYDYTAIKNAVEELGGEVLIERDFTGDSDYESLIKWRNNAADKL